MNGLTNYVVNSVCRIGCNLRKVTRKHVEIASEFGPQLSAGGDFGSRCRDFECVSA